MAPASPRKSLDSDSGQRMANDALPVGASPGIRAPYRVDMSEFDSTEDLTNDSSLGRHSDGDATSGDDATNKPGTAKFLQYTERHLTSELLFCSSTGNLKRLNIPTFPNITDR